MKFKKIHPYLIIGLYICYFSQGAFYASGSFLSQLFLILIYIYNIYFFIKKLIIKEITPAFYKLWVLFFIFNILGFLFTGDLSITRHFSMLKRFLLFSLTFFSFYYLTIKGIFERKHLVIILLTYLPITIVQFYIYSDRVSLDTDSENVVNNVSYTFVSLFPLLFFIKRKIISYFLSVILIFFIIQGAKRGAMIAGLITFILFIFYQLVNIDKKNKYKEITLVVCSIILIVYNAINMYLSNTYLIERLDKLNEGNFSNRDVIYESIFNAWYNSDNMFNTLFGFGFAASLEIAGNYAHSDWLELLSNFGLVGVFIYFLIFFFAFKNIYFETDSRQIKIIFLATISIWLITTIFSMGYTSRNGYILVIVIAYLLGIIQNAKKNKKIK